MYVGKPTLFEENHAEPFSDTVANTCISQRLLVRSFIFTMSDSEEDEYFYQLTDEQKSELRAFCDSDLSLVPDVTEDPDFDYEEQTAEDSQFELEVNTCEKQKIILPLFWR